MDESVACIENFNFSILILQSGHEMSRNRNAIVVETDTWVNRYAGLVVVYYLAPSNGTMTAVNILQPKRTSSIVKETDLKKGDTQ